jgi:anti-sigma-K factor RskA
MADVRREAELLHAAGPAADRPPRRPTRQHRRWTRAPRWAVPAAVTAALAVGFAAGALVRTGDERVVPVATTEAVRGTHARLLLGDDHATLVADHLPAPPAGRIYQVWLKPRDGEPEPTSALFVPRADGTATVALPARAADMELVMVSAEPPVLSARPRS